MERQKRVKSFWGGLAEEARGAAKKTESEEVWAKPPPYAPQDGTEHKGEGWGEDALGVNREEALESTSAHKREGEENKKEKGNRSGQKWDKKTSEGQRTNQNVHFRNALVG